MTDEPKTISMQIYYEKSRHFRVIHADGAYGGVVPLASRESGPNIAINFYSERSPIPKQQTINITDAAISDTTDSPDSKKGLFREIEVCAILDLRGAKALRNWLNDIIITAQSHWDTAREDPDSDEPDAI